MTARIIATLGDVVEYFEKFTDNAELAAALAINQVAEREALPSIRKKMTTQVAFPKSYLNNERLGLRRKASRKNLEAVISGRDRPTSLARFANGRTPEEMRGRQIRVQVKPGQSRVLKNAFLVRLKNNNIGLAVRLKPGDQLRNSDGAVNLGKNLFLLYGPSVDQVMKDVADQVTPDIGEQVTDQFLRQFARLSRG